MRSRFSMTWLFAAVVLVLAQTLHAQPCVVCPPSEFDSGATADLSTCTTGQGGTFYATQEGCLLGSWAKGDIVPCTEMQTNSSLWQFNDPLCFVAQDSCCTGGDDQGPPGDGPCDLCPNSFDPDQSADNSTCTDNTLGETFYATEAECQQQPGFTFTTGSQVLCSEMASNSNMWAAGDQDCNLAVNSCCIGGDGPPPVAEPCQVCPFTSQLNRTQDADVSYCTTGGSNDLTTDETECQSKGGIFTPSVYNCSFVSANAHDIPMDEEFGQRQCEIVQNSCCSKCSSSCPAGFVANMSGIADLSTCQNTSSSNLIPVDRATCESDPTLEYKEEILNCSVVLPLLPLFILEGQPKCVIAHDSCCVPSSQVASTQSPAPPVTTTKLPEPIKSTKSPVKTTKLPGPAPVESTESPAPPSTSALAPEIATTEATSPPASPQTTVAAVNATVRAQQVLDSVAAVLDTLDLDGIEATAVVATNSPDDGLQTFNVSMTVEGGCATIQSSVAFLNSLFDSGFRLKFCTDASSPAGQRRLLDDSSVTVGIEETPQEECVAPQLKCRLPADLSEISNFVDADETRRVCGLIGERATVQIGQKCDLVCDLSLGYTPSGMLTCGNDSVLTGATCLPGSCLSDFDYAQSNCDVDAQARRYSCQVECDAGYRLENGANDNDNQASFNVSLDECSSFQFPRCIDKPCTSPPPTPAFGSLTGDCATGTSFDAGYKCTPECQTGYQRTQNAVYECSAQNWRTSPPISGDICRPVSCPIAFTPLHTKNNAADVPDSIQLGDVFTWQCSTGYQVEGASPTVTDFTQTCRADTSLTAAMQCVKVSCGAPPVVADASSGLAANTNLEYPQQVTYICDVGYLSSTGRTATCSASGQFQMSGESCRPKPCPRSDITSIANADTTPFSSSNFTHGDDVTLACLHPRTKFSTDGTVTGDITIARQCRNGNWQGTAQCRPIECSMQDSLDRHINEFGDALVDSTATKAACPGSKAPGSNCALQCTASNFAYNAGTMTCLAGRFSGSRCSSENCAVGQACASTTTCTPFCPTGFQPAPGSDLSCVGNIWAGSPSCLPSQCSPAGLASTIANIDVSTTTTACASVATGQSCNVTCVSGFAASGPLECAASGFVGVQCRELACGALPAIANAASTASCDNIVHAAQCSVSCLAGFVLSSQTSISCDKGNFADVPACIACGPGQYEVGGSCTTCPAGLFSASSAGAGLSSCSPCPAGSACPNTGTSSPVSCASQFAKTSRGGALQCETIIDVPSLTITSPSGALLPAAFNADGDRLLSSVAGADTIAFSVVVGEIANPAQRGNIVSSVFLDNGDMTRQMAFTASYDGLADGGDHTSAVLISANTTRGWYRGFKICFTLSDSSRHCFDSLKVAHPTPAFTPATIRPCTASLLNSCGSVGSRFLVIKNSISQHIAINGNGGWGDEDLEASLGVQVPVQLVFRSTAASGLEFDVEVVRRTYETVVFRVRGAQSGAAFLGADDFELRMVVGDDASSRETISSDQFRFEPPPQVLKVSGCVDYNECLTRNFGTRVLCIEDGTVHCDTRGGQEISVLVTDIDESRKEELLFSFDGGDKVIAHNIQPLANNTWLFKVYLPPGNGQYAVVVVSQGLLFSSPKKLLSFALPEISAIASDQCDTRQSPTRIGDCPRAGNVTMSVNGTNFGSATSLDLPAAVSIGGEACLDVQHQPDNEDRQLTCVLPSGKDLGREVVIIQYQGEASQFGQAVVSYTPCAAGRYADMNSTSCLGCAPGRFAAKEGSESCDACPLHSYAAESGSQRCTNCPDGQHRPTTGSTECLECGRGFAALSGQECKVCSKDRFAPVAGTAQCEACPRNSQPNRKRTQCECSVGYYMLDSLCVSCPSGANCKTNSGVTATSMRATNGGFLVGGFARNSDDGAAAPKIEQCINPDACRVTQTGDVDIEFEMSLMPNLTAISGIPRGLFYQGGLEKWKTSLCARITDVLVARKHSTAKIQCDTLVDLAVTPLTTIGSVSSTQAPSGNASRRLLAAAASDDDNVVLDSFSARFNVTVDVADYPALVDDMEAIDRDNSNGTASEVWFAFIKSSNYPDLARSVRREVESLTESPSMARVTTETCRCDDKECYQGRLCSQCQDGFARSSEFRCSKCQNISLTWALFITGVVLFFGGVCILIWFTVRSAQKPASLHSVCVKIIVSCFQVNSLALGFRYSWPDFVENILDIQQSFASPDEKVFSMDCLFPAKSTFNGFYARQFLFMGLPVVCSLFCALIFVPYLREKYRNKNNATNGRSRIARDDIPVVPQLDDAVMAAWTRSKNLFITSMIVVLFLIHPLITKQTLRMFHCTLIGDKEYLQADIDVQCGDSRHLLWILGTSLPMILFYVIGIPLVGYILLRRNRQKLWDDARFQTRFCFLYKGYTKRCYFWEMVIVARKVCIVIIAVSLNNPDDRHVQSLLAILVIVLAMMANSVAQPFDNKTLTRLESASLACSFATFYLGQFLFSETLSGNARNFISIIVLLVNMAFFAFAFMLVFRFGLVDLPKRIVTGRLAAIIDEQMDKDQDFQESMPPKMQNSTEAASKIGFFTAIRFVAKMKRGRVNQAQRKELRASLHQAYSNSATETDDQQRVERIVKQSSELTHQAGDKDFKQPPPPPLPKRGSNEDESLARNLSLIMQDHQEDLSPRPIALQPTAAE